MADNAPQQLNSTTEAVKELQKALAGARAQIPEFSKGLTDGLTAIAIQLPDIVDSVRAFNKENKELVANGGKPQSILKQLATSMFSLNGLVSVGATLLITYGGEIINWVANLIKGEAKLSSFAKTMKDSKIIGDALIQTQINSQKSAQDEMTVLNQLYRASQNHNLSLKERNNAVELIRQQWPDTFKNISNETVLAGKAASAYKSLKEQILAAAYAEAAKNKIVENSKRSIDNDEAVKKERITNLKLVADLKKYNERHKNDSTNTFLDDGAGATVDYEEKADLVRKIAQSDKKIYALSSDKLLLSRQNEALATKIDQATTKYGVKVLGTTSNTVQDVPKQVDNKGEEDHWKKKQHPSRRKSKSDSADAMALATLTGFLKEKQQADQHFDELKEKHKINSSERVKIEQEHQDTVSALTEKFQKEDLSKLEEYEKDLNKTSVDAHAQTLMQITEEFRKKTETLQQLKARNEKIALDTMTEIINLTAIKHDAKDNDELAKLDAKIKVLEAKRDKAQSIVIQADTIAKQLSEKRDKDSNIEDKRYGSERKKDTLENDIASAQLNNRWKQEFDAKQQLLNLDKEQALDAAKQKGEKTGKIELDFKQKQDALDKSRLAAQVDNQKRYVKTLDSLSTAVSKIFGKNTVAARMAFRAHQAAAAAQVIIDTRQAIMGIWKANAGFPIIGTAKAIAETAVVAATGASNLATVIKQKPAMARGGQFISDGRGAVLPGYSRTDDTNAYLRSGEAVVVSEAMRNPWARNLVSAINVAHGGRDFSVPNGGRGYAIGGIFTDGGNANRYYSAPVNDQKDLANTLAYQMINNFPPIYVDVKDVNNQQNILAQTVNRVTL